MNKESKYLVSPMRHWGKMFVYNILFFLSFLTLGLATPWVICARYRYITNNTQLSGKRLKFNGKGGQLFGSYIKWWLLSLITLGFYYTFYFPQRLINWYTSHTEIVE